MRMPPEAGITLCMCTCVQEPVEPRREPEEGVRLPGADVIGSLEPPNMGVGKQMQQEQQVLYTTHQLSSSSLNQFNSTELHV